MNRDISDFDPHDFPSTPLMDEMLAELNVLPRWFAAWCASPPSVATAPPVAPAVAPRPRARAPSLPPSPAPSPAVPNRASVRSPGRPAAGRRRRP